MGDNQNVTVTFDTKELRSGLQWVTSHIDKNPSNPADNSVVVSPVKDGTVVITGGSDQSSARAKVPATGGETESNYAIHADSLAAVVRASPGDKVEFTYTDSNLQVKSGPARSKLTYVPVENTTIEEKAASSPRQGTVQGAELVNVINALGSIPTDDPSAPLLSGVKVDLNDNGDLELAATDKRILGATSIGFNTTEEDLNLNILIPGKTLQVIARDLPTDEEIWVHWDTSVDDPRQVALSTDTRWVSFNLLGSPESYPPYRTILKNDAKSTIEIGHKEFQTILGRITQAIGTRGPDSLAVTAETENEAGTSFNVSASGLFSHEEDVPARITGEAVDVVLSARYVANAVKAVRGDKLKVELADKRVVITSDHVSDVTFVVPKQKS